MSGTRDGEGDPDDFIEHAAEGPLKFHQDYVQLRDEPIADNIAGEPGMSLGRVIAEKLALEAHCFAGRKITVLHPDRLAERFGEQTIARHLEPLLRCSCGASDGEIVVRRPKPTFFFNDGSHS